MTCRLFSFFRSFFLEENISERNFFPPEILFRHTYIIRRKYLFANFLFLLYTFFSHKKIFRLFFCTPNTCHHPVVLDAFCPLLPCLVFFWYFWGMFITYLILLEFCFMVYQNQFKVTVSHFWQWAQDTNSFELLNSRFVICNSHFVN